MIQLSIYMWVIAISIAFLLTFSPAKVIAEPSISNKNDSSIASDSAERASRLNLAKTALERNYLNFDSLWVAKECAVNALSRVHHSDPMSLNGRRITFRDACESDSFDTDTKLQEAAILADKRFSDKAELKDVQRELDRWFDWRGPEPTRSYPLVPKYTGDFQPHYYDLNQRAR